MTAITLLVVLAIVAVGLFLAKKYNLPPFGTLSLPVVVPPTPVAPVAPVNPPVAPVTKGFRVAKPFAFLY